MAKKILCLSPHPDDVEIGMAGTILKSQYETDIIVLSNGGVFDITTAAFNRMNEVREFWQQLEYVWISHLDVLAYEESRIIAEIEAWMDCEYEAIYTPPLTDTHFEHQKVARVGRALVRSNATALFEYNTISNSTEWAPNYFVPLSLTTLESKLVRLGAFKSQRDKDAFKAISPLHAHVQCTRQGFDIVEQFKVVKYIDAP